MSRANIICKGVMQNFCITPGSAEKREGPNIMSISTLGYNLWTNSTEPLDLQESVCPEATADSDWPWIVMVGATKYTNQSGGRSLENHMSPKKGVPNGGWRDAAGNWRCPSLRPIKRSAPVLKWNHGVWVAQCKEEKRFSLKCVQPHCQDRLGWDVSAAAFDLLLRSAKKRPFAEVGPNLAQKLLIQ